MFWYEISRIFDVSKLANRQYTAQVKLDDYMY